MATEHLAIMILLSCIVCLLGVILHYVSKPKE